MTNIENLTSSQLHKVAAIKEKIEQLQSDLAAIAGDGVSAPATRGPGRPKGSGRRTMSPAARARIAAAQRARWARVHAAAGKTAAAGKGTRKRRKVSPAVRAKLAAIAKARWAKVKASGKTAL